MYNNRKSITKDLSKAVHYFNKSCARGGFGCWNVCSVYAEQCYGGDLDACHLSGKAYTDQGYPQHSIKPYAYGCERGNMRSCVQLGFLYEKGYGVTKDLSRAREFYQRACAAGESPACKNLKKLKID